MSTQHHQQQRIVGVISRQAECRVATDGTWVVKLQLAQLGEPSWTPLVVTQLYGQGEAAAIAAHSAASRYRAGLAVMVWCTGFGSGHTRERKRAIKLLGADCIQLITT